MSGSNTPDVNRYVSPPQILPPSSSSPKSSETSVSTTKSLDLQVHRLSDEEFVNYLRNLGGTPDEILASKEMMEFLTPTMKADFQLTETFDLKLDDQIALPYSITAMCGKQDNLMINGDGNLRRWKRFTSQDFEMEVMEGGHFYLSHADHSKAFFAYLIKHLSTHHVEPLLHPETTSPVTKPVISGTVAKPAVSSRDESLSEPSPILSTRKVSEETWV